MYNVGNFTMADTGWAAENIEHIARWEFYNGRAGGVEHAECLPLVNLWLAPPQPWLCQSGYILGQTPKNKLNFVRFLGIFVFLSLICVL